ncbi:hypothetical protein BHOIPH791_12050 [Bartonella henselae]|uniref:Uncharacterized protein n=2 Tax=Bartonella henselae TaxID=38323 RepID=X5M845_BARHN|nr:DUF4169 family protein [Bartonella henselae]ATP12598.1 DUF4169 domain-containing protein [Bartonella henselae]ETS08213.1 hypothetical protein Q654_01085 [Bartonella henselae JK 50]ETS08761.1 hypothetical protein Q655_01038 [Bartonella henselae JK 51]ETS11313.1 hypothetical protein Q653_00234 [Bartonella henselae JK 42]ETS15318.1 hypothetical protein Q652_00366 [Bartonella henselae JK 41]
MTKPINLRQFRKQKKRAEQAIHAEENRYRFGRTKAEKIFEQKESLKTQKFLDQNRLWPSKEK